MGCQGCDGDNDNLNVNEGMRGCGNPCNSSPNNTPQCETLPSQIENFTTQFFGTVIKTEVNGAVVWSLPCGLDVGLPNNPRGVDEGLACYFLRLFANGITGLTGPKGATGAAGVDGRNSYTVTLQPFNQPTPSSPQVTVITAFNPTVLDGMYVFIDDSGWYLVNGSDGNGGLFLQLVQALAGASGSIAAGKLVVPSGTPGNSVVGPRGPIGPQGPQGPAGNTTTATNGHIEPSGTPYLVTVGAATVVFGGGTTMQASLPVAGTYLIEADVQFTPISPVTTSNAVNFLVKLKNLSTGLDVPGSVRTINNMVLNYTRFLHISALVTTSAAGQVIALQAAASQDTPSIVEVNSDNTEFLYVRIS